MTISSTPTAGSAIAASEVRRGVVAALICYGIWGFLPLLFHELRGVEPVLVVADRTLFALLLVGAMLLATGTLGEVRLVLADRRKLVVLAGSAVLLAFNWLIYVYAIISSNVLEASFGYFINPLVNVALGMVLLGERQTRWQAISIGIAAVAIAIQWVGLGRIPYIALGLAFSFGFYGYLRKTVSVSSTTGLFVETVVLLPVAAAYLAYSFVTSGPGPHADPYTLVMLLLTGPATALPLLFFAVAVRRLRLTTVGMFQYLAPSIAFLLAVLLFNEPLNEMRLMSFALIWLSLAIFSWDSVRQHRARPA